MNRKEKVFPSKENPSFWVYELGGDYFHCLVSVDKMEGVPQDLDYLEEMVIFRGREKARENGMLK